MIGLNPGVLGRWLPHSGQLPLWSRRTFVLPTNVRPTEMVQRKLKIMFSPTSSGWNDDGCPLSRQVLWLCCCQQKFLGLGMTSPRSLGVTDCQGSLRQDFRPISLDVLIGSWVARTKRERVQLQTGRYRVHSKNGQATEVKLEPSFLDTKATD